jgi:hypothetical protein
MLWLYSGRKKVGGGECLRQPYILTDNSKDTIVKAQ